MKKLLTCAIAVLIGLTLFACSGETTPPTTDPESQQKAEQTQAPATEPSVTEPEEIPLTEFEQKVIGEWKHAPEAEPVIVKEDRTMSIDGVEYTWKAQEYGGYGQLYAFLGEETKYRVLYQETDAIAYIQVFDEEVIQQSGGGAITSVHWFRQEAFSHLPDYYGEYYPKYESYNDKDIDYASPYMVIGKDGTLTVENEQYDFYYCYNTLGNYFPIQKDGKDIGTILLNNTDGEEYLVLSINGKNLEIDKFVKSPDCERITITADNWKDYFEVAPVIEVNKNAFGDLEHVTVRYIFGLKSEFKAKALMVDCDVECLLKDDRFDSGNYTYNLDTGELKTEVTAKGIGRPEPGYTRIYDLDTSGVAIFEYGSTKLEISGDGKIAKSENSVIPRMDAWEILRIQGGIMLDK